MYLLFKFDSTAKEWRKHYANDIGKNCNVLFCKTTLCKCASCNIIALDMSWDRPCQLAINTSIFKVLEHTHPHPPPATRSTYTLNIVIPKQSHFLRISDKYCEPKKIKWFQLEVRKYFGL